MNRWRAFGRRLRRDWKPAVCCGAGGALGVAVGFVIDGSARTPAVFVCAGIGAILGSYFYALIE